LQAFSLKHFYLAIAGVSFGHSAIYHKNSFILQGFSLQSGLVCCEIIGVANFKVGWNLPS
jgi:hypothetical protein